MEEEEEEEEEEESVEAALLGMGEVAEASYRNIGTGGTMPRTAERVPIPVE